MASLALLISCIPTRAMIVLARDSNVFNKKVKDDSVNVIQKSEPERPFEWIKNVEEKIIRSRISWILFPAWFTFVVLNLFNSFKPYGEPFKLFNISIGFFIVLPFVFSFGWLMPGWGFKEIIKLLNPQFPDSMEDTIMYFSPVLFYVGYIALLVNIKKINKKWLYLILFFLLIFLVLSARGCANEEFSF